ncbi:GntP family permease [Glaciecola siphonariae]|uniref:GntP family permease n=1 Tax=Glaciecola siphonariae TaxID=521012 RepID=A0ABV9LZW6_9ALTE
MPPQDAPLKISLFKRLPAIKLIHLSAARIVIVLLKHSVYSDFLEPDRALYRLINYGVTYNVIADYPLILAASAVIFLLVLIIQVKLHAFIALVLVSALTAWLGGIAIGNIMPLMMASFGSTLAAVALLVGLGAMIGKLLEISGGAQVLADTLINRFGPAKAPFALGIASLLFGFPIFFDAGLIVMLPVILSVARRFGGSILLYAMPAAGAFAVMHALVPPHPGPVVAADLLGANIGYLLLWGVAVAIPTWYLGSYVFSKWIASKFDIAMPTLFSNTGHQVPVTAPPSFAKVLFILLLPLLLICLNTGISTYQIARDIDTLHPALTALVLIGQTPIALLITLLLSLVMFAPKMGKQTVHDLCNDALGPICAVILVTGAGGMFGGVLRGTGIGDALSAALSDTGMPIIVAAFVIAASLRVAQGSATVALTTTAALIAPMIGANTELSPADLCFIVIAIAGGASVLSHFNDSGFWLVSRLFNMDEKTTLKTWTPMVTLIGVCAFLFAALLSIFF